MVPSPFAKLSEQASVLSCSMNVSKITDVRASSQSYPECPFAEAIGLEKAQPASGKYNMKLNIT